MSARHAPATLRNREPILAVLRRVLPAEGTVLEVASGTGEHGVFFARQLPGIRWQPTDVQPEALASIEAHRAAAGEERVLPPLALDATRDEWPVERADAIFCANMIHIAPFAACEGLMRGAGRVLEAGAPLLTYGPYAIDGAQTAPSNARFDASLRQRDPRWGVRDLADVVRVAEAAGLRLEERVPMPANNFTLVFRKT
ncbi:MAG TPA: DUF938 domain-containing protein [Polyangiaceae bacterium LLY-WYZ-15_(1-7)]|mgnify:CR=1 FL=1|nr:SAM-dependent methyltransferase [Myxococcales bacterium]MAT28312.1 SAM-dependent methyltransferase [Sandaracinus sp.]HJL05707.1 DUF938 domain-containing protein [Polyangiaceae bacterium LLY-WYZ-15_(1-7)]MBJ73004.1 SAM-dependent methyltransferase [Sandaracinus sp.]HJL08367.1 DUF938 domain-containing protein [Polyangiaceae bacterium LLY-WYZ-15_(1-7)]